MFYEEVKSEVYNIVIKFFFEVNKCLLSCFNTKNKYFPVGAYD